MKNIVKIIVGILMLLLIGGFIFVRSMYPTYKGDLELSGLSDKVSVIYDEVGVPHIKASNDRDAYVALGYVHAQDRLWQMELMRRITAGRLSAIFGKDLIKVDKFMGSLGVEESINKTLKVIDKTTDSYKLAEAYLEGINQFIDKGATPIEFHLLGVEKEKYTIKDVYHVFGYISFSFAQAFKQDPLINEIQQKLGTAYVQELIPSGEFVTKIKRSKRKIEAKFSTTVNELLKVMPTPLIEGSNSWVLGSKRTKNKKVIFANDPHIGFSQPSIWYQAHVKTPTTEIYGFNLALVPFPLLGHNKDYAYGITMFENDDIDFYIEKNNPANENEYQTEDGFKPYKIINKTIKVKGGDDVVYDVKVSRHGPIMNDVLDNINNKNPIAMQWIYNKTENNALQVAHKLTHLNSLKDLKESGGMLSAPGLNFMYGDAKDNIAMYGVAKLYKYRDSVNRNLFLDGASGKDEIESYIDFKHNIQSENPMVNYVYSANNQHDSIAGMLYPGYYLPEDRAERIVSIISAKEDFTKQDVMDMALDVKSDVAPSVVLDALIAIDKSLLSLNAKKALDELATWDGTYKKTFVSPSIYYRFMYEFAKATYADELGDGFKDFLALHLEHQMRAIQMKRQESVWWDDITTKNVKETKIQIVTKSFQNAVDFLENQLGKDIKQWNWSKVYAVHHPHVLEKGGDLLKKLFSVGPFPVDGAKGVISNMSVSLNETGYYVAKSGPSTRRVIDFSDIDNSVAIIPTGQSGNIFSPYYKDQARKFIEGKYVNMYINPKDYQDSNNKLNLNPVGK